MPKPSFDYSALSIDERLLLIDEIWASVLNDDPSLAEFTPDQLSEIDRRAAEHDQDPETAVPWETARAEILRNLEHGA